MTKSGSDEALDREQARSELAGIAASLRAYLEWHEMTGTVGFTRATATPGSGSGSGSGAGAGAEAGLGSRALSASTLSAPALSGPALSATGASAPSAEPPGSEGGRPPSSLASGASAPVKVRLAQLEQDVSGCRRCGLEATRTQTVFARGNPDAKLCFVGEAPGAEEDAQGRPFVGRAGQLLDRMITAMGLSPESDVYICNIVKCRPPENRRPEPSEIATCIPYLHEQLALVRPRVIVALGNTAVAALLDSKLAITKVRGQWKLYRAQTLVMPTYHPSYLLRPSPQQIEAKRQAWQDLQLVMKELGLGRGGS